MAFDGDNVQGNILPGFNTDHQVFMALNLARDANLTGVRDWIMDMKERCTTAAQVSKERRDMKDEVSTVAMSWVNMAFGRDFLKRLRPDDVFLSRPFDLGFARRRFSVMKDTSSPADWTVGGDGEDKIDALIIVAGNHRPTVEAQAQLLAELAGHYGFSVPYRENGIRIPGDREHFGFKDGISQPDVQGVKGDHGLPLGQFLFGHKNGVVNQVRAFGVSGDDALAHDGSFLVFRRLRQNVPAFRAAMAEQTVKLQENWPDLNQDHLEALVVGRWPNGELVSSSHGQQPVASNAVNEFTFLDDPDGTSCPLGAHIRKVNPRQAPSDEAEPEKRRFLRRGIPFGPVFDEQPDADRGLLFLSFQTDINEQTDFVTRSWMNSRVSPHMQNDLLVGRGYGPRGGEVVVKRDGAKYAVTAQENAWVTPDGGDYLFMPSISGMTLMAQPPSGSLGSAVARNIDLANNALRRVMSRMVP